MPEICRTNGDGQPLYQRLAGMLAPLATSNRCGTSGWSSLGIVAGATWPEDARHLRAALPDSPFLVPDLRLMCAGPEKALAGLKRGDYGWEGGLVNGTRGLVFLPQRQMRIPLSD